MQRSTEQRHAMRLPGSLILCLPLLMALTAHGAQQSLVINGSGGTLSIPSVPPFTAMGSTRLEARIHNITDAGGAVVQVGGGKFGIEFAYNVLCAYDWADFGGNRGYVCTPSGFSLNGLDLVVRAQRDAPNKQILLDVFNYQTGALITSGSTPWTGNGGNLNVATGNVGSSGQHYDIAWLKWYSTLVPPGAAVPYESAAADLADFHFNSDLVNQGTAGYNITLSFVGAVYAASPGYSPVCNAGPSTSFRAGFAAQLDGSGSRAGDESSLKYFWQQIGSDLPDAQLQKLRWSSHTLVKPTITGLTFGPANFELTVTQGDGQSNTCTAHDGAVATDNNGSVVTRTGNAGLDNAVAALIGPQVKLNANPWPFYDQAAVWDANLQIADLDVDYAGYWNTPSPGTVTVTPGSNQIVGSDPAVTRWTTTICQGPANPTVPQVGSNGYGAMNIIVWYPTGRGAETGRMRLWVQSCQDDNHVTWTNSSGGPATWPSALAAGSGYQYTIQMYPNRAWDQNNMAPANFYDSVQAFYALYFRSGIDTYLLAARKFADRFWTCPQVDRGNGYVYGLQFAGPGRANSVSGLILRALDTEDGHPDMWEGLHKIWTYTNTNLSQIAYWLNTPPAPYHNTGIDPRETGYLLAQLSYCAMFDTDSTWQANCRSNIETFFGPAPSGIFPAAQDSITRAFLTWFETKSTFNPLKPWTGSTVTLANGSTAVTCTTGNCGWQPSDFGKYSAFGLGTLNSAPNPCSSGSSCGYAPVLFTGDGTSDKAATFPADNSKTDADTYCYPSGCTYIDSSHFTLDRPYGGVSGAHGWVFGSAGGLNEPPGWGGLPYMHGILGWAFDLAGQAMTCVGSGVPANCDNATSSKAFQYSSDVVNWMLNSALIPSYYGSMYYAGNPVCTQFPSVDNIWCVAGLGAVGSREILGDGYRGIAAVYRRSPTDAIKAVLDNWYAGMWGKPGTNPLVATPDGQYDNNFDATGCSVNAAYPIFANCGSNGYYLTNGTPFSQKFFGQHFGISNQASWPAIRMGSGPTPNMATVYVGGEIASVRGAVKMGVTVTEPTGVIDAPTICSSSPCAITVNRTIGNPVVQVSYLDASGKPLSSGEPFMVTVN